MILFVLSGTSKNLKTGTSLSKVKEHKVAGGIQYDYSQNSKVEKAYDEWHDCVVKRLGDNINDAQKLWGVFRDTINDCRTTTAMKNLNMSGVHNKDEFKFHLFNQTDKNPSYVVTLGVGWDVKAEELLKGLLPNGSLFFGADPIYAKNDELFSKIGQFYPIAVGNETKVSQAYVMPPEKKGWYVFQTMVHIDIITFLKKLVAQNFVDQLLMDNEGPEYDIIPMMGVNREFDDNGLVVCQINAEIHSGHPNHMERLQTMFQQVLKDRRYAVLYVVSTGHHRTFLLNMDNKRCVEKYVAQYFK
ncbi:unnamed protein product [Caenorhabditis auriculariae]|uniref:Methyltransferase FkbM domain-containing protein n=1 Tax=Caenorhabditis auriculariae TaxID=2777116 RepID=A0A8S1H5L1_9PELO|nr:unnamed protein product [Caenorhabditis auriculariae]